MKPTEESSPSVSNIKKNMREKKGAPGNVAIASGYTMKTRPGPSAATSFTSTLFL